MVHSSGINITCHYGIGAGSRTLDYDLHRNTELTHFQSNLEHDITINQSAWECNE